MKRGVVRKHSARLINVWVPKALLPLLDQGIAAEDSDRSKFIRQAVREKLQRLGIKAWAE